MPGELQVRGWAVMKEYTEAGRDRGRLHRRDGWFRTGDAAMWLPDGHLRFLGRYKDMLKVGGENVDPMETEALLLEHPAVQQVAVVGLPDGRLGEVPVAYVECRAGATIDADDVVGHCRGKIESIKLPRQVVFVDVFPMSASGNIRKAHLRETPGNGSGSPLSGSRLRSPCLAACP